MSRDLLFARHAFPRILVNAYRVCRLGRPRVPLAGVLFFLVVGASPGEGQVRDTVPRLGLAEAIGIARRNNPELLQQANDRLPARAAVRAAYGSLLPSAGLSSSVGYTAAGQRRFQSVAFGEQPGVYTSSYQVGLQYDVSGTELLQPSVDRAQARATERLIVDAEANLTAQVTQRYLTVLQAGEAAQQAEREVERTAAQVRLAEARRQVGVGIALDVRRAEVTQGQAEVRLIEARTRRQTEMLALGRILGVALPLETQLVSEFALFEPDLDREALTDAAIQTNPGILAARAIEDAAGTQVRQARTTYLPTLSMSLGWSGFVQQASDLDPLVAGQLNPRNFAACQRQNQINALINAPAQPCLDPADPLAQSAVREAVRAQNSGFPFDYNRQPLSAGLTLSLPLFDGFSRSLQVQRARANREDAEYQVRARELQTRQEVGTAVLGVETAYRTAQVLERARATAAEELRLAEARFRAGAAHSLEVTDAQTRLSEAERAQIEAVYNFHQSLALLEALVGIPLRQPPATPATPATP